MNWIQSLVVAANLVSAQTTPPGQTGQILTLDQAVQEAVAKNYTVKLSQITEMKSRDQLRAALSALGYRFAITGDYTRYAEPPGGGGQGFSSPIDSKTLAAALVLPLDISGTAKIAIKAARFNIEANNQSVVAEVNSIKARVRGQYYDVLRAGWLVSIQQESVDTNIEQVRIGNAKVRLGTISNFDLLRLENGLKQAESGLVAAENQKKLALSALSSTLLRPVDQELEVAEMNEIIPVKSDSVELTNYALVTRPEIKSVDFRINQFAQLERYQANQLKPTASVSLIHSQNLDPGQFQKAGTSFLKFEFTIPVKDGGLTAANVASAKRDTESVRVQRDQLADGIRLQVRQATLGLATAQSQMDLAKSNLAIAKEAYRLAQVRFNNQLGIVLDVTTAQESFTRARGALAQAVYDYLNAYSQLQLAVGDDKFIQAGDALPQPLERP